MHFFLFFFFCGNLEFPSGIFLFFFFWRDESWFTHIDCC